MSLVRRVFAGLGALMLLLGIGSMPASAVQQSNIEKSIVLVGINWAGNVKFPDDGKWYEAKTGYLCTGWIASKEAHIVTAEHCVRQDEDVEIDLIEKFLAGFKQGSFTAAEIADAKKTWPVDNLKRTVRVVQPSHVEGAVVTKPTEVDVLAETKDGDHALLKLNGVKDVSPLKVATTPAKSGDEVSTYGFSDDVSGMTDADTEGVTRTQGRVASVDKKVEGTPYIGVDMSVDNGMSGGPILNSKQEVLGINSFGSDDGSADLNFGSDLGYLTSFLKNNDVELVSSSGGETPASNQPGSDRSQGLSRAAESDGMPGWAPGAIIGGIILLVVGAIVVVVVIRRRNRPSPLMMVPAVCSAVPAHYNANPNASFCGVCGAPMTPNPGVQGTQQFHAGS